MFFFTWSDDAEMSAWVMVRLLEAVGERHQEPVVAAALVIDDNLDQRRDACVQTDVPGSSDVWNTPSLRRQRRHTSCTM
jgi:hypothetical protein